MSDSDRMKTPVSLPRFSGQTPQPNCASVPLALYCELSEELEVTQQQLQKVHAHNQKLAQQNQQLQQEIHRLLESGSMAEAYPVLSYTNRWQAPTGQPPLYSDLPTTWPTKFESQSKPVNSIVLATSIVLIVLTAFTCSFLIVRPLLDQQQR